MRNLVLGIASLWPGAAQAWLMASGRGLLLAAGFAGALNVALVGTFAWPRWPASLPAGSAAGMAWLLVLGLWGAGLVWLRRDWPKLAVRHPTKDPEVDAWFTEAQHEYLKGHWVEAETVVRRLLARQPNDIEARLLLASIQRRTDRVDEAASTLVELQQSDRIGKWPLEIDRELSLLRERQPKERLPNDKRESVKEHAASHARGEEARRRAA